MIRNIRQYWQEIRALEASLPPFVWLASTGTSPVVMQATAATAAKLIHHGSHRQATAEEVEMHRAAEKEADRWALREAMAREGAAIVVVD